MSNTIISVILSFTFATVLGSLIAYNLQHRNWIRQQQVSTHEKKIADLGAIFTDLDTTFSRRLYWTRRLLYATRRFNEERLIHAINEYDKAISEWNEKRNSFQIRLAAIVGVSAWQEFEHSIAQQYVELGAELERFAREARIKKSAPAERQRLNELEKGLDSLSHTIYNFTRTIYLAIQNAEQDFYSLARQKRLPKNDDELSFVSTWFLLKSLFIPIGKFGEEL